MDPKLADAGTFVILKEDHTLGNILRMSLLRDKRVLFAGYRMPHPLEHKLLVKIKTRPVSNPVEVMNDAIDGLTSEVKTLQQAFQAALQDQQQRRDVDML